MSDNTYLIERMKLATGPDREIDRAFVEEFGRSGGGVVPSCAGYLGIADFTGSVDAILSLIDAKLPLLSPGISYDARHGHWHAWLGKVDSDGAPHSVSEADNDFSAPLALCIAFLQAIEQEDTKPAPVQVLEVTDEEKILRRLADGDSIAYSRDGDYAWFTQGDRARIGRVIISMREKGYFTDSGDVDWDGDSVFKDSISEAGRSALSQAIQPTKEG